MRLPVSPSPHITAHWPPEPGPGHDSAVTLVPGPSPRCHPLCGDKAIINWSPLRGSGSERSIGMGAEHKYVSLGALPQIYARCPPSRRGQEHRTHNTNIGLIPHYSNDTTKIIPHFHCTDSPSCPLRYSELPPLQIFPSIIFCFLYPAGPGNILGEVISI